MKKLLLFIAGRIILENALPVIDGLTEWGVYQIKLNTLRLAKRSQRLENEIAGSIIEEDMSQDVKVMGFEIPQENCHD